MRLVCLLSFVFVFQFVSFAEDDNALLRRLFHELENEQDLDSLLSYRNEMDNVVALSYFGSATLMKAQYPFSPFKKFEYFSEGKKMIEESILQNKNVENTYLRLIVQLNTPRFLGYYHEIEEDISFLENNIDSSLLSNTWKVTFLKKALLFESKDYDFGSLKTKLSKYKALCQNH